MTKYPNILHALNTAFNVENGLSEAAAIRLYVRSLDADGQTEALKSELREAFDDPSLAWVELLSNDDYDVYYAESEEEAKTHARRLLWEPILGSVELTK